MKRILSKKLNKRGFTLVEMIAVGALLAIATGVAVPAYTGYIDREKSNTAIVQCKQCVAAAQSLCVERYAAGKSFSISDEAEIMEDAGVLDGDITSMTLSTPAVTVSKLVFAAANGVTVTYRDNEYIVGQISAFTDKETLDKMLSVFSSKDVYTNKNSIVDSAAANASSSSNAFKIEEALLTQNIDFDAMNAASWRLLPANGSYQFYWTPVDISTLEVGTLLPVMRYNFKTGTYTVWIQEISEKENTFADGTKATYKIFSTPARHTDTFLPSTNKYEKQGKNKYKLVSRDQSEQTYEDMMYWYNQALIDIDMQPEKPA